MANDSTPSYLYRNSGKRKFEEIRLESGTALSEDGNEQALWILDNDGWLDLIVASGHVYPQVNTLPSGDRYREPKLLDMNQGNGTFCDAHDQAGSAIQEARASRGLAVGDLFNDGNMDVVISNLEDIAEP